MDLPGKSKLHYQITEKLGEGGMGVVYKALDTRLRREVAIKFMPHHVAANEEMRARFQIEAQAVATLNHPNITTIYAIETLNEGEHDEEVFFVMEYIAGRELKDRIKEGNLSVDEAVELGLQIAAGLQAAHDKGITHRDIKPSNIMLTPSGRVKLMDFGLARIGATPQITKPNATFGTVAYMSPEQARGRVVDHRSDIWSFGIMLYEMLAGQLPFDAAHEQSLIYAIIHEEPHPIRERVSNIPPALEAIIEKALKKDLDKRYQSAISIIEDLNSYSQKTRIKLYEENGKQEAPSLATRTKEPPPAIVHQLQKPPIQPSGNRIPVTPKKRDASSRLLLILGVVAIVGGGLLWLLMGQIFDNEPESFALNEAEAFTQPETPITDEDPGMPLTDLPATDAEEEEDPVSNLDESAAQLEESSPTFTEETAQPAQETTPINTPPPAQTQIEVPPSNPPVVVNQEPAVDPEASQMALRLEATEKRNAMLEMRNRIPAGASETGIYQQAIESQQMGERLYNQESYDDAGRYFDQARMEFQNASEATRLAQKTLADEAANAMNQAMAALGSNADDSPALRAAQSAVQNGQNAYESGDYVTARAQYLQAIDGFESILSARAATEASASARSAQINSSRTMLQQAFAQEDIDMLASVVELTSRERSTYDTAFSAFSNFSLSISSERQIPLDDGGYRVEIQAQLSYSNNKNQQESTPLAFVAPLSQLNGGWVISKFRIQ